MLLAHVVPGYFAAAKTAEAKQTQWNQPQRIAIWVVALGMTVLPDSDVIYNALFRGFINHSTLWTHSIFVYLGIGIICVILWFGTRWKFAATIVGLIAFEGIAHLVLDVLSHGTPLFYPLSWQLIGIASRRVVVGGFWTYITDPIFLLEPILISLMVLHWIITSHSSRSTKRALVGATVLSLCLFATAFLLFLPELQGAVLPLIQF